MSASTKATVFLALTFLFSWGVTIGGWAMGMHENPISTLVALTMMMAGPAIGAVVCAMMFEKGRRAEALGFTAWPNLWWLWAWAIGVALALVCVAAMVVLTGRTLVDPSIPAVAMAEKMGQNTAGLREAPYLGALIAVQALVIGPVLNAPILTITEELGWRGYLHFLWRPSGFWRASLSTGAVWGVWHAPAIYLFGLNYPDHRALGVGLFVVFCTLLGPLMTLVRDRGRSVVAAGILHGTINAVAGLTVLAISNPEFPWDGMTGAGGFVALALGVVFVILMGPSGKTAPASV